MKNLQLRGCSADSAHLEVNNIFFSFLLFFLSSFLFKHKILIDSESCELLSLKGHLCISELMYVIMKSTI